MRMKRGETGWAARVKVAQQQVTLGAWLHICARTYPSRYMLGWNITNISAVSLRLSSLEFKLCPKNLGDNMTKKLSPWIQHSNHWDSIYTCHNALEEKKSIFSLGLKYLIKFKGFMLLCLNHPVRSHVGVADFIGDRKIFAAIIEKSWISGFESHTGTQLLSPSMT